ncbi:mitochondrial carnitine/acylcarnitine carrier protein-like [Schistocerca gregaria]|uniref:mitochondrial carnitine/acylcarnitine carrier protein-like n=1 Tax=Schistocerca gregaria TaxID=7010 RepID=UPI00211ECB52|nr:mitochondrial carnitine/acylcarnitine carrier protein-like [Schistocerca gregaria]
MSEKNAVSPVKYLLCGGFGGMCAVAVDHPLEMGIRTLPESVPVTVNNVPELFTYFVKTFRSESLKTIYRGSEKRFTTAASISSLSFFGYGLGRRLLQKTPSDDLSFPGLFLAGAFSGLLKSLIVPLRNDNNILNELRSSVKKFDVQGVLQLIIKRNGIRNVYDGSRHVFYKEIPLTGLYFMTYDGLRHIMVPEHKRSDICVFRTIVAGGMAGIVFSAASIIVDKIQCGCPPGSGFKGLKDSLTNLTKQGDILSVYRGYAPVMIRAFPVSASCFLGFQTCLSVLNWIAPNPI